MPHSNFHVSLANLLPQSYLRIQWRSAIEFFAIFYCVIQIVLLFQYLPFFCFISCWQFSFKVRNCEHEIVEILAELCSSCKMNENFFQYTIKSNNYHGLESTILAATFFIFHFFYLFNGSFSLSFYWKNGRKNTLNFTKICKNTYLMQVNLVKKKLVILPCIPQRRQSNVGLHCSSDLRLSTIEFSSAKNISWNPSSWITSIMILAVANCCSRCDAVGRNVGSWTSICLIACTNNKEKINNKSWKIISVWDSLGIKSRH